MPKERTLTGYTFHEHGRGEITFLDLTVHVYEIKNSLAEYQAAVTRAGMNTEYRRQQFECVERARAALGTSWGKPGEYLERPTLGEQCVEIRWQASARIESWYGPRVSSLDLRRGSINLFIKLVRQMFKRDPSSGLDDRPGPDDLAAVLHDLKAVTVQHCEMEPSGLFWLPVADSPVPECPFKTTAQTA